LTVVAVAPEDEGVSMKRSWAAIAAMVVATYVLAGCAQTGTTFQNNTGAQITALSPLNIPAASSDFTLTVTSTGGFVAKTVIQWNGKTLPNTTLLSATTATVLVPAALVAKSGTASVNTLNPPRNSQDNGLSNTLIFAISGGAANPVPTITTPVSPKTARACGASCANSDTPITILGTNFLPSSTNGPSEVQWSENGVVTVLTVQSITPTQITAAISGVLLSNPTPTTPKAIPAKITVVNPPSFPCSTDCVLFGGGPSNPEYFTVN
jgi:hypothetical protein